MTRKKASRKPAEDLQPKALDQMSPEEQVRAVPRTCRGPLQKGHRAKVNEALSEGRLEDARQLDSGGRVRCGADFNDVILAHPLDGQERTVACPKCGQPISYRAPLFEAAKPKARRG